MKKFTSLIILISMITIGQAASATDATHPNKDIERLRQELLLQAKNDLEISIGIGEALNKGEKSFSTEQREHHKKMQAAYLESSISYKRRAEQVLLSTLGCQQ